MNLTQKNKAQFNRLSAICADIAQVALGSVVVPFLFDRFNLLIVLLGLTAAFTFWLISIRSAK